MPTTATYLASAADPTIEQYAWSAVLHCGEGACLGGRNALVLNGWRGDLQKPFDVVVTSLRAVPSWIRPRRVRIETPIASAPPRVNAHDAVLQAAAWARTGREAMYIVISSLQQGISAEPRLSELLVERPRLRRRLMIATMLEEFSLGSQSLNELDLGPVCRKNALPQPVRQVLVHDVDGRPRSIDAEFEGPRGTFRVEIEGMHHLSPEVWFTDMSRHNKQILGGQPASLRYSSWSIRYDPAEFVADMRTALNPRPAVTSSSA